MSRCKFADRLGKPGEGIHRVHVGGVAVVDLLLTMALALGLSYIPGSPPLVVWIVALLLVAILIHASLCTPTSVNRWIYRSNVTLWLCIGFLLACAILLFVLQGSAKARF